MSITRFLSILHHGGKPTTVDTNRLKGMYLWLEQRKAEGVPLEDLYNKWSIYHQWQFYDDE